MTWSRQPPTVVHNVYMSYTTNGKDNHPPFLPGSNVRRTGGAMVPPAEEARAHAEVDAGSCEEEIPCTGEEEIPCPRYLGHTQRGASSRHACGSGSSGRGRYKEASFSRWSTRARKSVMTKLSRGGMRHCSRRRGDMFTIEEER